MKKLTEFEKGLLVVSKTSDKIVRVGSQAIVIITTIGLAASIWFDVRQRKKNK